VLGPEARRAYGRVLGERKARRVEDRAAAAQVAAKVEEDPATKDILVTAEDALSGRRVTRRASLLVLATGIVPQTEGLPAGFVLDEFRFVCGRPDNGGFYGAGCVRRPEEVSATIQDATGAALKALQCLARSAHHG
jgi:quinone-modifying oxidoreductase subunit QmoA